MSLGVKAIRLRPTGFAESARCAFAVVRRGRIVSVVEV